ncbi:RING_finger and CHY zinc finger domain-containing protein [Hexamita inflata]|uniref:RING finger and CHY zinc finger domain-containing protein n=1 Tax=Hexamita inflata TaxID=28002 RepID=A0AA86PVI9_9EUKA|nr:RING finger and CHY zinc finger domain-containing protein [Hexamita inflata]CAI9970267.1 RING finger and CHY zinc finger domain-containing protein [Hexamita inflata]
MIKVKYLDPIDVTEEHRNTIILAQIFKLPENEHDRFDASKRIILKEFANDVVSKEFGKQQLEELKCCYRKYPVSFMEANGGINVSVEYLQTIFQDQNEDPNWWQKIPDHEQIYKAFTLGSSIGCAHYISGCELQCAECEGFFGCRRCHDELVFDHSFPKKKTMCVRCRYCAYVQPFATSCIQCKHSFGAQSCEICRFVADFSEDSKPFYHCEFCDACNVGFKEFTYHCPTCDSCMSAKHYANHRCLQINECCVCLGDLKGSKFARKTLKCSHMLHEFCYDELLRSGNFKCPVCKKFSPVDEQLKIVVNFQRDIFSHQVILPKDEKTVIGVGCNDCGAEVPARPVFTDLYYCQKCGLFNCERNSRNFDENDYQVYLTETKPKFVPKYATQEYFKEFFEQKGINIEEFVQGTSDFVDRTILAYVVTLWQEEFLEKEKLQLMIVKIIQLMLE